MIEVDECWYGFDGDAVSLDCLYSFYLLICADVYVSYDDLVLVSCKQLLHVFLL